MENPILTLDTSAINHLADDPESEALIAGLTAGFFVRHSFSSVSEVIATTDPVRRSQLIAVWTRLLSSGDCIDPQHEVIRKMVSRFEAPAPFDWATVDVRFIEVESEILRAEVFTDELAAQEREESRALKKRFHDGFDKAKPAFDKLFASGDDKIPGSVSELVIRLQEGGAYWKLAGDIYAGVSKKSPDEATLRRFVAECDPFRALMVAVCTAQYERCFREKNGGPSLRAGRIDTFMAVSLPYCHRFLTGDRGQLACYNEVVSIANLGATVQLYDEFRNGFLLAGETTGAAR